MYLFVGENEPGGYILWLLITSDDSNFSVHRSMEIPTRKTSKRTIEPVDEWLQNEGYYRKHVPKDPTSLFRAVSEQVYKNQRCHIRVRKECIAFMKENRKMFEEVKRHFE